MVTVCMQIKGCAIKPCCSSLHILFSFYCSVILALQVSFTFVSFCRHPWLEALCFQVVRLSQDRQNCNRCLMYRINLQLWVCGCPEVWMFELGWLSMLRLCMTWARSPVCMLHPFICVWSLFLFSEWLNPAHPPLSLWVATRVVGRFKSIQ